MITKEDLTKRIAAAMVARNSLRSRASRNVASAYKNKALLEFQKTDSNLTADGLYGPNSKAAIAWYIQTSSDKDVPDVNPRFAKSARTGLPIAVTWNPPQLVAKAKKKKKKKSKKVKAKKSGTGLNLGIGKRIGKSISKAGFKAVAPARAKAKKKKKKKKKSKKAFKDISRAVGKSPSFGQEVLAQTIGKIDAEDVISAVATGAPYLTKAVKSLDAESSIAKSFAKNQSKALKGIKKTLLRGALQREATSEHKTLNKRNNFRKSVLRDLKNIKAELARRKAGKGGVSSDYRIVGLLL